MFHTNQHKKAEKVFCTIREPPRASIVEYKCYHKFVVPPSYNAGDLYVVLPAAGEYYKSVEINSAS